MTAWRWLIWRACAIIVRTRAYWMATVVHVLVLAAFLLVWGEGLPTVDGTALDQLSALQRVTLAVVLPWLAARCGSRSRGAVTHAAAMTATPPSRWLLARAGGVTIGLTGCALAGLPMVLLAQQISARPAAEIASPLSAVAAMIGFVAMLTTWCEVLLEERLTVWLVVCGATLLILVTLSLPMSSLTFALTGAAGLAGLAGCTDPLLRYLPDTARRTSLE